MSDSVHSQENMLILGKKRFIFPPDINMFAEAISISREKMLILGKKRLFFPLNISIFAEEIRISAPDISNSGANMLIFWPNMLISGLDFLIPALSKLDIAASWRGSRPSGLFENVVREGLVPSERP